MRRAGLMADDPADYERVLDETPAGQAAFDSLVHAVDQLRQEIGAARQEIAALRAQVEALQEDVAPHKELYEDFRAVGRIGRGVRNFIIVVAGILAGSIMTYQAVVNWLAHNHDHLPPGGS